MVFHVFCSWCGWLEQKEETKRRLSLFPKKRHPASYKVRLKAIGVYGTSKPLVKLKEVSLNSGSTKLNNCQLKEREAQAGRRRKALGTRCRGPRRKFGTKKFGFSFERVEILLETKQNLVTCRNILKYTIIRSGKSLLCKNLLKLPSNRRNPCSHIQYCSHRARQYSLKIVLRPEREKSGMQERHAPRGRLPSHSGSAREVQANRHLLCRVCFGVSRPLSEIVLGNSAIRSSCGGHIEAARSARVFFPFIQHSLF